MGGKNLGGDEGGKTVIQINCMKKLFWIKNTVFYIKH